MKEKEIKVVNEEKALTRKDFLKDSSKYALGALVGISGLSLLRNNEVKAGSLESNDTTATWPMPYVPIDEDAVRLGAHTLYWNDKDCGTGVFGGISDQLVAAIGDPWTYIPKEVLLHGRGGGAGWGTLCGTLNGGAAIISLVTTKADSTALINELWGWYGTENLPTAEAHAFTYTDTHYTGDPLASSIPGGPLCHASVSQWCLITGKTVSSTDRKERCARLAGDIAVKTVQILNAHFAGTFVPTYAAPASNAECTSCHSVNVSTQMECVTCHDESNIHTKINDLGVIPFGYELHDAYPNPFNSTTNINFSIPTKERVRLEIYNIKGQLVNSIIDSEDMMGGTYQATWDGTDNAGSKVTNGMYLARLTTGKFFKTIKINHVN